MLLECALLAGAVLAWRSSTRRIDGEYWCRGCHYRITPGDKHPVRCTECGADLTSAAAIQPRRVTWILPRAFSIAALFLFLALIGPVPWASLVHHLPMRAIISGQFVLTDEIVFSEAARREVCCGLDEGDRALLLDRAVANLASSSAASFVTVMARRGLLSPSHLGQIGEQFEQCLDIVVPTPLLPGVPSDVSLKVRAPETSLPWKFRVKEVDPGAPYEFSSDWHDCQAGTRLLFREVLSCQLGRTCLIRVEGELMLGKQVVAFSADWPEALAAEPIEPDTIQRSAQIDGMVREGVCLRGSLDSRDGRPIQLVFYLDPMPMSIALQCFLRQGDKLVQCTREISVASRESGSRVSRRTVAYLTPLALQKEVSLVAITTRRACDGRVGMEDLWAGALLFHLSEAKGDCVRGEVMSAEELVAWFDGEIPSDVVWAEN